MSYKLNLFSLLILSFALIFSCAPTKTQFIVTVNSLSSEESNKGKKYVILSDNKEIKENDLQFKEYKKLIDKILMSSGYQRVESKKEAEMIVLLSYSISGPKVPTYEQIVSSSNIYGSVSNARGNAKHTSTYNQTYGITDSSNIVYTRTLDLRAVKNQKKLNEEMWRVTLESEGSTGDLRIVFPVLAVVAQRYVGISSNNKVTIRIDEDDERIRRIRN